MKNHLSLRFAIAKELTASCRFRLGLTGTPFGRDPLSLWAQAFLVDGGRVLTPSYYFFEAAFSKTRKAWFNKNQLEKSFDKAKLPVLQNKMSWLAMAYKRAEVAEVNILAGTVRLTMTDQQRLAYTEQLDELVERRKLDDQTVHNTFVRLRQIASGFLPFVAPDGSTRILDFAHSSKLAWLLDFAEELPSDVQCVIFHEFTHSGELICKTLTAAKVPHVWIHGGVRERKPLLDAFASKKARILVANTVTGGTAIDLANADYLCFFESPVSPIVRQQAEARPLNRGKRLLMVDDLVCAPVEDRVLGFVREGKDLMAELVHRPQLLASWRL